MPEKHSRIPLEKPAIYEIQVQGLVNPVWLPYFDDLQISVVGEDGWAVTTLTGSMVDQAALQGTMQKLYNLGFVLLKVERRA